MTLIETERTYEYIEELKSDMKKEYYCHAIMLAAEIIKNLNIMQAKKDILENKS